MHMPMLSLSLSKAAVVEAVGQGVNVDEDVGNRMADEKRIFVGRGGMTRRCKGWARGPAFRLRMTLRVAVRGHAATGACMIE